MLHNQVSPTGKTYPASISLPRRVGAVLLACIGGLCLIYGMESFWQNMAYKSQMAEARGEVISVEKRTRHWIDHTSYAPKAKRRTEWVPRIRFQTPEGQAVIFEGLPLDKNPGSPFMAAEVAAEGSVERDEDEKLIDHGNGVLSVGEIVAHSNIPRRKSSPGNETVKDVERMQGKVPLRKTQAQAAPPALPERLRPQVASSPSPTPRLDTEKSEATVFPANPMGRQVKSKLVGTHVNVLYNPRHPQQAWLYDSSERWFPTVAWLVPGIVVAGLALLLAKSKTPA
ncbi:MAG: hypothetical protein JST84_11245 [Acidobacteria bacterium]|nr:hypothetical protein [Acidobacteriota bacterium]